MKFRFKKRYLIILLVVAAIAAAWLYSARAPKVEYQTAKATRGRLVQTVSDTGMVKTANEINLNFLSSGKVANIYVKIGDQVKAGQVLAEIDLTSFKLNQKESQAALNLAQANLNKLINGASATDLAVSRASTRQAEVAYQNAQLQYERIKTSSDQSVAQAQKTYDDLRASDNIDANNKRDPIINAVEDKITAARTALDAISRTISDSNAKDTLSIQDPSMLTLTRSTMSEAQALIAPAEASLNAAKLAKTDANLDRAVSDVLKLLNKTYSALNYCFAALQKTVTSSSLSQASLDALKTSISAQLTSVTAGISAVQGANQALKDAIAAAKNALNSAQAAADRDLTASQTQVDSAYNAWQLAKAQLLDMQAPARSEDIQVARAQVLQAQAALDSVLNQIENNYIKAPIDGIITQKNYEVGETANGSKPVIAMLSKNNYEIEIDISETDINKVHVGDSVEVTFDAFGEDSVFTGKVAFIEPAQTVIQDVIYYKTTIADLRSSDGTAEAPTGNWAIKPGMTANAVITTAAKDSVVAVPARAILEKDNGDKTVRVLINGAPEEKIVVIGLRADEGLVEVLSGLDEGQDVVTSTKTNSAK